MTLRAIHGNARRFASGPRVEVLPPDELPRGVVGSVHAEARDERTTGGRFAKGARTAQSRGGVALKNRSRLASDAGLDESMATPAFKPYLRSAKAFARQHVNDLARTVGGGTCGPGAASIVTTAALQLAGSRYMFDLAAAGDAAMFVQAARLGDASRQNLLAAHELVAREAASRPRESSQAALARRLGLDVAPSAPALPEALLAPATGQGVGAP